MGLGTARIWESISEKAHERLKETSSLSSQVCIPLKYFLKGIQEKS